MTESQIEKFICLASTLNVSRAADALGISQPALSKQLAAMEASLGFPLFERGHNCLRLTDAGKIMLSGLSRMTSIRENIIERARDAGLTNGRAKLRLGLTGQWTLQSIGDLVCRLQSATGEDGLRLLHDQLEPALKSLNEKSTDLLITAAVPESVCEGAPSHCWKVLFEDELLLLHFGENAFDDRALQNESIYYVPGACPASEYLLKCPRLSHCNPNLIGCRSEEMFWQVASGDCFGAIGRSDPMHQLSQYCFYETGVTFPVYLVYPKSNAERIEKMIN